MIELYDFSNTLSRHSNLINKIIYKSRSQANVCKISFNFIMDFAELFTLLFHF